MRFFLIILALCVFSATGCASKEEPPVAEVTSNLPFAMPVDPPPGSYMLTANTYAGDALHKMLLLRMDSGGGILTTSLVSLDNFDQTSAFGRLASQQVGSRIGQYGFRVLEARLGAAIQFERRTGEFMLTRDACKLLADTYDANAVLVGCYSISGGQVFVSVRVVRLSDNTIMGAYEYFLPCDATVAGLLGPYGGGMYGGLTTGGDSVWEQYAHRTPAFFSGGGYTAGYAGPGGSARAGAAGVGRRIDPAAPPTPFPGGKKK